MVYGSMEIENTLRTIFRRCVQCPPGTPSCPKCPSGQTCTLKAESCTECASTVCIALGTLPGQATPPSKPIGAIVGGVVGGVAFFVIMILLLWLFWIRPRRKQEELQLKTTDNVEKRDQSTLHRSARQSTRSAHSIASTVLTRASNVIQIAYIPGVTNRSPPDSPNLLVPPVPALPPGSVSSSTPSTPYLEQDRHFFMPGDLRDSTYSDFSEMGRQSIAPSLARTSVAASAILPPAQAQQATRTRPAIVSVHLPGSNSSSGSSPPVPQVPKGYANSSIVGRPLVPRPVQINKPASGTRVPTLANLKAVSMKSGKSNDISDKSAQPSRALVELDGNSMQASRSNHQSQAVTYIEDSPISPIVRPKPSFTSATSASSSAISTMLPANNGLPPDVVQDLEQDSPISEHSKGAGPPALTLMIEEAMSRAARGIDDTPVQHQNDSGPFSDANEIKEHS